MQQNAKNYRFGKNLFVSKKGLRLKENFQIEEISWVFFKATRNSQTRV